MFLLQGNLNSVTNLATLTIKFHFNLFGQIMRCRIFRFEPHNLSQTEASRHIDHTHSWKTVYRPSGDLEAYRMSLRAKSGYFLQYYLVSTEYAKAHNKQLNVYNYYFNTSPPGRNSEFYGAYHSADLWYFFNSIRDTPGQRNWTGADYRLAEAVSSYLANFVKTGNPNGEGLSRWEQTSDSNRGAFMWFRDGYANLVNETPYADRDALNRRAVLRKANLGEKDLGR